MRITVMTILLISAAMAAGADSLDASPGVLWEYALAHSNMMHSMDNLIVSSDMTWEASGRLPDLQENRQVRHALCRDILLGGQRRKDRIRYDR